MVRRKTIIRFLIFVLLCGIAPAAAGEAGRAGPLTYEEADRLRLAGRTDEALAVFEDLAATEPDHPLAWRGVVECLVEIKGAAGDLEAAIAGRAGGAAAWDGLGYARYKAGDPAGAREALGRALADDPGRPTALNLLGAMAARRGERGAAESFYKRAIVAAEERKAERPAWRARLNLGLLRLGSGDHEDAEQRIGEALAAARQKGYASLWLRAGYPYGRVAEARGDLDEALRRYEEALSTAETLKSRLDQVVCLDGIGNTRLRQGDFRGALEAYDEALRRSGEEGGGQGAVTRVLVDIGRGYFALGELDRAGRSFGEALSRAEQAGDPKRALAARIGLANVDRENGNYYRALDHYAAVVEGAEQADRPLRAADGKAGIGLIYWDLGNYQEAIVHLEEALQGHRALGRRTAVAADLGNLALGRRTAVAADLGNLALVHKELGDLDRAEEYLREALRLDEGSDTAGAAADLANLAELALQRGDLTGAAESLAGAEQILGTAESPRLWAEVHILAGDLAAAGRKVGDARESYAKAIAAAEGRAVVLWRALHGLGRLEEAQGRSREALSLYREAAAALDPVLWGLLRDEDKAGFLVGKSGLYEDLIDLLLRLFSESGEESYMLDALRYLEQCRGLHLQELFNQMRPRFQDEARRRHFKETRALEARLDLVRALEESRTVTAGEAASEEGGDGESRLKGTRAEYESLLERLRRSDPMLFRRVSVGVEPIGEVQARLGPDEAIIEYYCAEDRLVIFSITGDAIEVRDTPWARKDLETSIRELRRRIAGSTGRVDEDEKELNVLSRRFYKGLIEPVAGSLAGKRTITIIPDRQLYYLPFQALLQTGPDGKERYLIEDWALRFLSAHSGYRSDLGRGLSEEFSILGFGNADGTLPSSEAELARIGSLFPGARVFLRDEASEIRVKELAGSFDVLHLASHGRLVSQHPGQSHIVLAGGGGEDGKLTVEEIYGLDLRNVRLVTLSACQTALGVDARGEEMISLTDSFHLAGAETVVATLWEVEDAATGAVMERFYRNLQDRPVAEALRVAQLELMREQVKPQSSGAPRLRGFGPTVPRGRPAADIDYTHPFYWAPYILLVH